MTVDCEQYWNPSSRCCNLCYHYVRTAASGGHLVCEHDGKRRKRPNNYTNCKKFGYIDMVTGRKVVKA